MKKWPCLFLSLFLVILTSCTDSGPVTYTSIKGAWRCEEYNPITGNRIYMVEIDPKKSDNTQYLISNFYNEDVNEFIFAGLNGNKLTISQQQIVTVVVKSGSGTVSADFKRIDLQYKIYDGLREFDVVSVLTR